MSVENFIDTNLFIYQIETEDVAKADIANRIIRRGIEAGNACISFQVVQECLNTIVRKAEISLTEKQAEQYLIDSLSPLLRIYPSISFYRRGLEIQNRYQFSFYDSLIVAAALADHRPRCGSCYNDCCHHYRGIADRRPSSRTDF